MPKYEWLWVNLGVNVGAVLHVTTSARPAFKRPPPTIPTPKPLPLPPHQAL